MIILLVLSKLYIILSSTIHFGVSKHSFTQRKFTQAHHFESEYFHNLYVINVRDNVDFNVFIYNKTFLF